MTEQIKKSGSYLRPVFLFVSTLVTISIVELLVMFSLRFLPDLNSVSLALLDSFLLVLFAGPILYVLLLTPLKTSIQDRMRMEFERKKISEMAHMKNEFIAVAAHELRTPLAAVLGYSELILGTRAFNEEYSTVIIQKAHVMERLLDDLDDHSLSERGLPLRLQKETADIVPVIVSIIESNKKRYPSRYVAVQLPESKVQVTFDRTRIEQVLDNILSNANKFSSVESPIEINATLQGGYFTVQVSDQGIGMSLEESGQVFDKYYRADFSNSSPSGLGLGMSIVKEIIVLHGGEVRIKSMPRVGTTVSFDLPAG